MRRQTQGLLLAFLGTVLLRLAWSDLHLRFVADWMTWPILLSGVVLLLLAIGPTLVDADTATRDGHDHAGVPRATWLLVLPGLVFFVISPPELGSYLAERRANQGAPREAAAFTPLSPTGVNELPVQELVWRAQTDADTLVDRTVALTGFVSHQGDRWFVTRLTIGCCAADAMAFRVEVDDDDAAWPPRDRWVRVTGTYVEGTGATYDEDAVVAAQEVAPAPKPRQTYE